MSDETSRDEAQWQELRAWLSKDEHGRKILSALVNDRAVGEIALQRRLRSRDAPGIANQISNAEIHKFANFASADNVYLGDQHINVDRSYHYTDVDLDPMRRARGLPRFLYVVGTLVALSGFAVFLYGMYQFVQEGNSSMATFTATGQQTAFEIPSGTIVGFGLVFAGIVLITLGYLFRPREQRPPPPP